MSTFWPDHLRSKPETELKPEILDFFTGSNSASMLQLAPPERLNFFLMGNCSGKIGSQFRPAPLYMAVAFRLGRTVRNLVESSKEIDNTSSRGQRYAVLDVAVRLDDSLLLEELLSGGANVDVQDRWGLTPLHLALALQSSSKSPLISMLLAAKAATDIGDQDGDMAIQAAAGQADVDTIILLLAHGVDVNAQNKGGETALHVATRRGSPQIADVLLKAAANPSITDSGGTSVLKAALVCEEFDILKLILQNVDDRFSLDEGEKDEGERAFKLHQNSRGRTPRDVAQLAGHERIVALIENEQWMHEAYCGKTGAQWRSYFIAKGCWASPSFDE